MAKTDDQSKQPKTTFQRDPDFRSVYSNFIQTGYTFFDVSLEFCENQGMHGDELLIVQRSRVTMSPAEAKVLLTIMHNVVSAYENQFGEISVPEGTVVKK